MRKMRGERRASAAAARRDPAPSRLSYRLNRLALTPGVRRLVTTGLPLLTIGLVAAVILSDEPRREALNLWVDDVKTAFQDREAFMVKLMAIDGASEGLADTVRATVPVEFPISSFQLDLVQMQDKIAVLDAVSDVNLRVRPGGVLQINITERQPAVVWRGEETLELLDRTGHRVEVLDQRAVRADLPLIAGEAVADHIPEALALFQAAAPLNDRLRGLLRVGERRWDVVLDRGQRILLPELAPVSALEQVIAMEQAQELLARDVTLVDMRNPARPTVRLDPETAGTLRKIKLSELGAD
ncbi:hypothetical protein LCGC14_2466140 [marine sediment metagenome]|uniref:POTRA domain-containing protein n=1 Tax=marine sediment metagenome TaxID=412755 RepID=A0A0F9BCE7_9ZZZZ